MILNSVYILGKNSLKIALKMENTVEFKNTFGSKGQEYWCMPVILATRR
jgi:hypothetical protein